MSRTTPDRPPLDTSYDGFVRTTGLRVFLAAAFAMEPVDWIALAARLSEWVDDATFGYDDDIRRIIGKDAPG